MSRDNVPEPASPSPQEHPRPVLARTAWLCGAWLPFFALLNFLLPRFTPIFKKFDEKGDLPTLTRWLFELGQLNTATIGLPTLAFFAGLIFANYYIARATSPTTRGQTWYGVWFAAVIYLAIIACVLFLVALQLPVYKFSASVK
jgi:hypothetical protein